MRKFSFCTTVPGLLWKLWKYFCYNFIDFTPLLRKFQLLFSFSIANRTGCFQDVYKQYISSTLYKKRRKKMGSTKSMVFVIYTLNICLPFWKLQLSGFLAGGWGSIRPWGSLICSFVVCVDEQKWGSWGNGSSFIALSLE